jgi:hypothetical protein
MKITEITEGYANTDEGFPEAWSTAKKGAKDLGRLATGAAWRQAKDMGRGVAAKMGFAGAAENQKMQRIAGGVAKNFSRYIAQRGLKQDTQAVQQYLAALGFNPADIKMSSGNTAKLENNMDEAVPSNAQIAQAKAGQSTEVNRNELIKTIADTIQSALQNNRVPKAIEKFTKV